MARKPKTDDEVEWGPVEYMNQKKPKWSTTTRKLKLTIKALEETIVDSVTSKAKKQAVREALDKLRDLHETLGAGCPHNGGSERCGMDSICSMCGDWI